MEINRALYKDFENWALKQGLFEYKTATGTTYRFHYWITSVVGVRILSIEEIKSGEVSDISPPVSKDIGG